MTNATFQIGKKYEMRFIGDADLRPQYTCVKRTEKTATFTYRGETITRRVKTYPAGGEFVILGDYSMSPVINAKDVK